MKPLIVLFIGAVAAAAPACGRSQAPEPEPRPAVQVRVVTAESSDLPGTIDAGGTVRARHVAVLSSRIVAPVMDVRVRAGDRVRAGQPLVVLDSRDLLEGRSRADAALAAALQGVAAAEAEQQGAAAALTLATAAHGRIAGLRERNSATAGELDEAVAGLRGAEARASGTTARRLEAERATEAARAGLRAATITESYGVVNAPFDGIVTARSVDPGSLAAPGQPLVTVEDVRQFRLEVPLDVSRTTTLRKGERVPVLIDSLAGGPLDGTLGEIAESIDPVGQTLLVKIDLPPTAGLRTGLYGRAQLTGSSRTGLTVPQTAVVRRGQLAYVFVDEQGVARMRLVHTATPAEGRVPILAGVSAGDRVIVDPPQDLTDGTRITAAGPSAGPHPAGGQP
jgi:RND family efflux transporter MFP subunit